MVWEIGQRPVTRSFEDFSNIARARADATLHVDSATGQLRVTDRENPFQRAITWVRDSLHLQSRPPAAQTGTEEVRGAYNRFLQAVAAERRYQEQLPWLEDVLAPEIMVDNPKPLTTRRIRDLTTRLEELARNGADTRLVADYFSGREGGSGLHNVLEDRIASRPALEQAGFKLSGAETDTLSGAIHDGIMAEFRNNQQEVSRQEAGSIAARLVDATLDAHEQRLLATHPAFATVAVTEQETDVVPAGANALPGNKEHGAGDNAPGIDNKAAPVFTPAPGSGATDEATPAPAPDTTQSVDKPPDKPADKPRAKDVAPEETSRQQPRAAESEPMRRSFIRRTIKQLRGRRSTFSAPAKQAPGERTEPGPAAAGASAQAGGKVEEKHRERPVDVPAAPAGPEPADKTGAKPRRSIRLGRGGAGRSSALAGSARPSRKDDEKRGGVIDKQRLSGYLKDVDLPRDVRAAVKILVRDGSVRNYGELFEAVNKATFEWACENRMQTWYGEALKGQGITAPRGKNRELPAELLAQVRTNVVSDREVLDYPGFKQQVRSMIGKYVLGQPL
ncbi:MAG: hypothetical protein OXN26_09810 [Gammaproteobacteria bacterium]|nr:hypothetical protein [Gammaproteobacteria bacterium]